MIWRRRSAENGMVLSDEHEWCLPTTPYVRGVNSICAGRAHHMCGACMWQ
ncbi:MAG: hypothetical protein HXN30_00760 [Prevotella histicola]|nr:hypothetical protein [Prevotella histicola]